MIASTRMFPSLIESSNAWWDRRRENENHLREMQWNEVDRRRDVVTVGIATDRC